MTLISPIILKKYGIPFSRVCTGPREGSRMVTNWSCQVTSCSSAGEVGEGMGQVWVWQGLRCLQTTQSPVPKCRSLTAQATSSVSCLQPAGWLATECRCPA